MGGRPLWGKCYSRLFYYNLFDLEELNKYSQQIIQIFNFDPDIFTVIDRSKFTINTTKGKLLNNFKLKKNGTVEFPKGFSPIFLNSFGAIRLKVTNSDYSDYLIRKKADNLFLVPIKLEINKNDKDSKLDVFIEIISPCWIGIVVYVYKPFSKKELDSYFKGLEDRISNSLGKLFGLKLSFSKERTSTMHTFAFDKFQSFKSKTQFTFKFPLKYPSNSEFALFSIVVLIKLYGIGILNAVFKSKISEPNINGNLERFLGLCTQSLLFQLNPELLFPGKIQSQYLWIRNSELRNQANQLVNLRNRGQIFRTTLEMIQRINHDFTLNLKYYINSHVMADHVYRSTIKFELAKFTSHLQTSFSRSTKGVNLIVINLLIILALLNDYQNKNHEFIYLKILSRIPEPIRSYSQRKALLLNNKSFGLNLNLLKQNVEKLYTNYKNLYTNNPKNLSFRRSSYFTENSLNTVLLLRERGIITNIRSGNRIIVTLNLKNQLISRLLAIPNYQDILFNELSSILDNS